MAGLHFGISDEDNRRIWNLLSRAGFMVSVLPATPLSQPELTFLGSKYQGVGEIQQMIEDRY